MNETYLRIKGDWYLVIPGVDSKGATIVFSAPATYAVSTSTRRLSI